MRMWLDHFSWYEETRTFIANKLADSIPACPTKHAVSPLAIVWRLPALYAIHELRMRIRDGASQPDSMPWVQAARPPYSCLVPLPLGLTVCFLSEHHTDHRADRMGPVG